MNSLIIFVLIASFTFFESSVQASSSPKYEACGFSSEDNFVTWSNSVNSNTPLLYPTDESELASILKTAAKHDCRVRVRGAGMTANGAVTQLLEEKVVVVSLFKFQNIPDWQNSISDTGVATISAGQSFFELMKMARPLGWLFPSPKAGYAGSIGGIVSNSVTGGAVGGGFVYESVVALRVMNSDGTAQDITDSTQLPLYVGAYGLTGIILAVRFQMAPDLGSNPKVLNYQYPMASQDPNIIQAWTTQFTADQTALFSTHSYVECFLNPWPDQVTLLNNVTCLTNVPTGQPFPDPSDPEGSASLKASYEAIYQGMTIDPIYRNLADAGCDIFNVDLCDPLFLGPTLCEDPVSRAYGGSLVGFISIAKLFSASQSISSNGPVDLFWQNQATPFSDLSYFIPQAQFGNALGIFLQTYLPFLVLGDSSTFLPTGYLTWRLIVPKHASAFEYLTPGAFYYHVDIIQLNYAHPRDKYAELDTLDVFQVIEKQWILLGGLPHQGKGWGYGTYEQWFFGQHNSPFITNPSLYTSDQITQLSSVIQPLFAAGSQIREFDPASYVPFEIRHLDGRTCADFNYLNCISEECSDQLVCVQSTATIFTTSITILFFTFFTTIFFF